MINCFRPEKLVQLAVFGCNILLQDGIQLDTATAQWIAIEQLFLERLALKLERNSNITAAEKEFLKKLHDPICAPWIMQLTDDVVLTNLQLKE